MEEFSVRSGLLAILLLCSPAVVWSQSTDSPADQELPSEAFLEFLGELEPLDEETWRLLERNALNDLEQNKEVNSQ
jgi:hypothetical protein